MRKTYDLIKTLRKSSQPRQKNIKDAENRVLSNLYDILKRWKEYDKTLYQDDGNPSDDDAHEKTLVIL